MRVWRHLWNERRLSLRDQAQREMAFARRLGAALVAGEEIRSGEAWQHAEIAPRHRMALEAAHHASGSGNTVGFGQT
jgi:hypothetical protein